MWGRARLPESVRNLAPDRAVAALEAADVNISVAAKRLGVPTAHLRLLVNVSPEFLALAAEKEEARLDRAEKILDRELASDNPRYSAAAAFFTLRNSRRAVARGWRQPDVEVAVNNAGPPVRVGIMWNDGRIATVEYPNGTQIPRPLELEHHDPARARIVADEEPARESSPDKAAE
jgi:hypothetical protein